MLTIRGLVAAYTASAILTGIDLDVQAGEIVALIGANGAGKSSLVKTISGLLPTRDGAITLEGRCIEHLSSAQRVRLGVAHVPEGRQVFAGLTVEENLMLGGHCGFANDRRGAAAQASKMFERFPLIALKAGAAAGDLSGGQQQMLAIARGLMSSPRLLLLDEPSLGLSPKLVAELFVLIARLREEGVSILLAEQNARQSLMIADRGYVIERGRIVMTGRGSDLLHDPSVAERYLGVASALDAPLEGARQQQIRAQLRVLARHVAPVSSRLSVS